jgi:hypothetical protein
MTSLSSPPQLLAILDNLVEVSDLTDEERLWVYDKFASRTGKGPTRKEAEAPTINAFTFLMRKNPCGLKKIGPGPEIVILRFGGVG